MGIFGVTFRPVGFLHQFLTHPRANVIVCMYIPGMRQRSILYGPRRRLTETFCVRQMWTNAATSRRSAASARAPIHRAPSSVSALRASCQCPTAETASTCARSPATRSFLRASARRPCVAMRQRCSVAARWELPGDWPAKHVPPNNQVIMCMAVYAFIYYSE